MTASPALTKRMEAAEAMDSLRRFVRVLRTQNEATQREHGVTSAQLFVLRQIAESPGLSLGALTVRVAARQSSVSEVVSRLVAMGLVDRSISPVDRRRVQLELTVAGEAVASQAPETLQERLLAGLESLAPETRRTLTHGLEAWLAASGLAEIPSTMLFEPDA